MVPFYSANECLVALNRAQKGLHITGLFNLVSRANDGLVCGDALSARIEHSIWELFLAKAGINQAPRDCKSPSNHLLPLSLDYSMIIKPTTTVGSPHPNKSKFPQNPGSGQVKTYKGQNLSSTVAIRP